MSLKPSPIPPVPGVTACVAHAAFPHGHVVMQLRDALGTIYTDEVFADLFPTHGQPAFAPWRLALVTVFQFMGHLTDRQAADAVRDRLAWKYALSLELSDAGFDHTDILRDDQIVRSVPASPIHLHDNEVHGKDAADHLQEAIHHRRGCDPRKISETIWPRVGATAA